MNSSDSLFNIVLIEPEIPQNTGNIGRTCVATKSSLHLVGKMGFEINDKNLKRAGLDYWQYLSWRQHETYQDWWDQVSDKNRVFFFSTKVKKLYTDEKFQKGDWFVFGRETRGLAPEILRNYPDQTLRIPQPGEVRSLNLATAAAIAVYEGLRQIGVGEL